MCCSSDLLIDVRNSLECILPLSLACFSKISSFSLKFFNDFLVLSTIVPHDLMYAASTTSLVHHYLSPGSLTPGTAVTCREATPPPHHQTSIHMPSPPRSQHTPLLHLPPVWSHHCSTRHPRDALPQHPKSLSHCRGNFQRLLGVPISSWAPGAMLDPTAWQSH